MKRMCILFLFLGWLGASAQQKETINWITFDQLDDSLSAKPKKVFIDFYTDWCTYCRKMDKAVFTKPEVVKMLNESYYAVKMNAESMDTVWFEGQAFLNDQIGKNRKPLHQLAQLLALREGEFAPPVMLVMDAQFAIERRYFQYLDSKKLLKALR